MPIVDGRISATAPLFRVAPCLGVTFNMSLKNSWYLTCMPLPDVFVHLHHWSRIFFLSTPLLQSDLNSRSSQKTQRSFLKCKCAGPAIMDCMKTHAVLPSPGHCLDRPNRVTIVSLCSSGMFSMAFSYTCGSRRNNCCYQSIV